MRLRNIVEAEQKRGSFEDFYEYFTSMDLTHKSVLESLRLPFSTANDSEIIYKQDGTRTDSYFHYGNIIRFVYRKLTSPHYDQILMEFELDGSLRKIDFRKHDSHGYTSYRAGDIMAVMFDTRDGRPMVTIKNTTGNSSDDYFMNEIRTKGIDDFVSYVYPSFRETENNYADTPVWLERSQEFLSRLLDAGYITKEDAINAIDQIRAKVDQIEDLFINKIGLDDFGIYSTNSGKYQKEIEDDPVAHFNRLKAEIDAKFKEVYDAFV
jgi:hypothetical protein